MYASDLYPTIHIGVSMRLTRLMIAGYDEDRSSFTVSVADGSASVLLTGTDEQGKTVSSMWRETADTLDAVGNLVERIVGAPTAAFS
jgi:hypothetical protein